LLGQEKICLPLGLIGSTCISLIPHFKLVLVQIFQYIGKIQGKYEGLLRVGSISVKSMLSPWPRLSTAVLQGEMEMQFID